MRVIFLVVFSILTLPLQGLNVVIIGGGPAGQSTAIEANLTGAKATIIEKRSSYSRGQLLFLFDHSLKLLEKWEVHIPTMQISKFEHGCLGSTKIKDLEEALAKRVNALGIQQVQGDFISIGKNAVTIDIGGSELEIPYDILVGADGAHSAVRDALEISCNVFGKAASIAAFIPLPQADMKAEMLPATLQDSLFVKRIFFPQGRIFILQYPLSVAEEVNAPLEEQRLIVEALRAGWLEEAQWIAEGKSYITPQIPVVLQQALAFSDAEGSVILVGDAAATAPFCQAMGANTALKTSELAGKLFAQLMNEKNESYLQFNVQMKEVTDALIWDSKYLVEEKHVYEFSHIGRYTPN
jgi:2-polyprenyl-6-methoxyphenol hydroxylase-like FAD-dependent oxidoreductase